MSTPFDVRQWASQAGITTTGGFAVVAECVTLEELQRFAQIAMEAAAIDLVKKNNRLDCIASELQDACHKQAQKIAQDEALAEQPAQPPVAKPHEQEPDDFTVWRSRALQAEAVIDKFMAQPQQEPVVWYCKEGLKRGVSLKQENPEWIPLYTSPPQRTWVGLTDEDIADATGIYPTMQPDKWHETVEIARAIEAKLKEKNEAAQN